MKRLILLAFSIALSGYAQQPFLTDDANVTAVRHWHLELLTEHDLLQRGAYPSIRQNTTRLQVTYGLLKKLEIGFDDPLLFIYNDRAAGIPNAYGLGDLDLQMKCNLRPERKDSSMPAISIGLYIELPTGDPVNQLGSGIADYWLNTIAQKTITNRITLRVNTGILFSGNTLTGAIGIKSTRGVVFTGASSLTYSLNKRLLVGGEVAGGLTNQFDLGKAQLQEQFGVKYALHKSLGLDFAVTTGKFEGSPRVGGAFGISIDF
jgi:hypothetical protein